MKTIPILILMVAVSLAGCRQEAPTATPPVSTPPAATVAEPKPQFKYSILHWNVESGGNDPATIAAQLIELGRYDIVGLSEVDDPEPYVNAITKEYPDDYDFIRGNTGINNGRDNDRLLIYFDNSTFELIEFADTQEA